MTPEISLEEGQALYQAAMNKAYADLAQKGAQSPNCPMTTGPGGAWVPYRGEVPPDITQLKDDQLGTYMGLLSEWGNYIGYQMAEADVNLDKAKANLKLVDAKLGIIYQKGEEDKKRTIPEKEALVNADRRYIEAQSEVLYWQTMYTLLRTIYNNAESSYSAISRRVTQRGQEVDRMNRTGQATGQTNIQSPPGPIFGGFRRT